MNQKIVISASRRTDIPAFYMEWFMNSIRKGFFRVVNPYNRKAFYVPAESEKVHTIVFWSKNFGPFIRGAYGEALLDLGYNLFFNFTVNSHSPLLEPKVPPLSDKLRQMKLLSEKFGSEVVQWRFDPICFYRTSTGQNKNNLSDFSKIAGAAAEAGIHRCVTSFMDHYSKISKRVAAMPGFCFLDPPIEKKTEILTIMAGELHKKNIRLFACCEKDALSKLEPDSGVRAASCIPNDLFVKKWGGEISLRKDSGQRIKSGCGCRVSKDIGDYLSQPCYHSCLFCYANPAAIAPKKVHVR